MNTSEYEGRDAYSRFMDEFLTESDRACIIVASAEMEVRLQLLFTKVLHTNAKLRKDIFGFQGALGSFSARIKMARAMGLIDAEFYNALDAFRALRNSIVHKGRDVALDDQDLQPYIRNILAPFEDSRKFDDWVNDEEGLSAEQTRFRYAVSYLILMIEYATNEVSPMNLRTQTLAPDVHID